MNDTAAILATMQPMAEALIRSGATREQVEAIVTGVAAHVLALQARVARLERQVRTRAQVEGR